QELRLQTAKQLGVGLCRCVVDLIDDHMVEGLRIDDLSPLTGSSEGLDGGEEVSAVLRARSVHPQLAEATILENRAEGLAGLAKDGVAVGDEEQRVHPPLPPLAGVVQGGDHRLAGS